VEASTNHPNGSKQSDLIHPALRGNEYIRDRVNYVLANGEYLTNSYPFSTTAVSTINGDVTGTLENALINAQTVTGKPLTGLVPAAGVVEATDTILQGMSKLAGTQVGYATALTTAKVTNSQQLILEQTGDSYGSSRIIVQNRGRKAGLEIDCSQTNAGVCDLDFTAGTKQIKARFETRTIGPIDSRVVSLDNVGGELIVQQSSGGDGGPVFAVGANRVTSLKPFTAKAGVVVEGDLSATANVKGRYLQVTGNHSPSEQGGFVYFNPTPGYNDMHFGLHRGSKGGGSFWWTDITNSGGVAVLKLDAAAKHMRMHGTMQVMEGLTVDAGTTSLQNTTVNGNLTVTGNITGLNLVQSTQTLTGSWAGGASPMAANIKATRFGPMVTLTFSGFDGPLTSSTVLLNYTQTLPAAYRPPSGGFRSMIQFDNGPDIRFVNLHVLDTGSFVIHSPNLTWSTTNNAVLLNGTTVTYMV
jgi:hypothetical protein